MPFKLTKEELQTRTQLIDELGLAAVRIEESVDHYNLEVDHLRSPVEIAVTKYNELVSKARELCSSISQKAELDIGDRSEAWLESDKGSAAQAWQESWEGISLDEIDYQWPDELEINIQDHADDLKDLPEEADDA
jgi:hypothetical protein